VTDQKNKKDHYFVKYIIDLCQKDNAAAAKLRRADNPKTENQSWGILTGLNIDLEKEWERLPHALVAAFIAKAKISHDGNIRLGRAILECYPGGNSDAAEKKLRRLISCSSTEEFCNQLKPIISLIQSRGVSLNYSLLLQSIKFFSLDPERQKRTIAQDFYSGVSS